MAERTITLPLPPEIDAPALRATLSGPVADLVIAAYREGLADHVASGQTLAAVTRESALNYPYLSDADAFAIIVPLRQADWLEEGRAAFSLAARWGAGGGRWKVNKKGGLYATVPFRHSTPARAGGGVSTARARSAMPAAVYALARQLDDGGRLAGFGDLYKQSKLQGRYTWKASPYEGLVHTTRPTPGGGHHSDYMTFRTITPDSAGWNMPPQPALHLAARALEAAEPEALRLLDEAAGIDAANAVAAAMEALL